MGIEPSPYEPDGMPTLAEAAKALERAEKIKAVKQDVRPVPKDEFSDSTPSRLCLC